jgi:hypothetical protein
MGPAPFVTPGTAKHDEQCYPGLTIRASNRYLPRAAEWSTAEATPILAINSSLARAVLEDDRLLGPVEGVGVLLRNTTGW